jgi:hypothetical protein
MNPKGTEMSEKSRRQTITYLRNKVSRIKQHEEEWVLAVQPARAWISPPDQPAYRPSLILIASPDLDKVLASELSTEWPTDEQVVHTLLKAMHQPPPKSGGKRRPAVVWVKNEDVAQALAPHLEELNIRCVHRPSLPFVDHMLHQMEASINQRPPFPGLLTIPGVTVPLVEHLYTLAADYYRLAPWQWLSDMHPMEIRYPPDAEPRYAVVMGSSRQVYGLAIYDTLEALRSTMMGLDPAQLRRSFSHMALIFDEARVMSFDDLDALEHYGWPVAAPHAYPWLIRTVPSMPPGPPNADDLFWLEGALEAIMTHVRRRSRKPARIAQPADVTISVAPLDGMAKVALRLPVSLFDDP